MFSKTLLIRCRTPANDEFSMEQGSRMHFHGPIIVILRNCNLGCRSHISAFIVHFVPVFQVRVVLSDARITSPGHGMATGREYRDYMQRH